MAINELDVPQSPSLHPVTPPSSPRDNFRLAPPAPERPKRPPFRVCNFTDEYRETSRKLFRKEVFKPRSGELYMLSHVRYICDICAFEAPKCCWKTWGCDIIECPVCGVYSPADDDWIKTE
jgi:hypothetical protein